MGIEGDGFFINLTLAEKWSRCDALSLKPGGKFAWTVTQAGKSRAAEGWAGYLDRILTLA
jgi:hypothetical protein